MATQTTLKEKDVCFRNVHRMRCINHALVIYCILCCYVLIKIDKFRIKYKSIPCIHTPEVSIGIGLRCNRGREAAIVRPNESGNSI